MCTIFIITLIGSEFILGGVCGSYDTFVSQYDPQKSFWGRTRRKGFYQLTHRNHFGGFKHQNSATICIVFFLKTFKF